MVSHEQFVSSSSLTGQSKECQNQGRDLLTSLAKCTKLKNSSARMGPSRCTAGKMPCPAYMRMLLSPRPSQMISGLVCCCYYNTYCTVDPQCWSREDWRVHHPQHRAGENEVRGRGRHLPDGQDAAHPETCHRPDRGQRPCR